MSTTRTPTHPDDLNVLVEFDSPFTINADGSVTTYLNGVYAPSVYLYVDSDGQATGPEQIEGQGWTPVTGHSGQEGYSGPVMHPSEQLAGGMAVDIMARPGVYVIVSVECISESFDGDDDEPQEHEPAGWMLLRNTEGN